jgi:hypothetical protein
MATELHEDWKIWNEYMKAEQVWLHTEWNSEQEEEEECANNYKEGNSVRLRYYIWQLNTTVQDVSNDSSM